MAYGCALAEKGGAGGGHAVRVAEDVDQWVIGNVITWLARPEAAELIALRPGADVNMATLRAEVKLLRDRKLRLTRLFIDDGDAEALMAGKREIDGKLAPKLELLRSATEVSPVQDLIESSDVRATWNTMTLGEKRVVLGAVCTVEIWPLEHGQRRFDPTAVRIHWKV